MKINGTNPETGETFQAEADNVDRTFVELMSEFEMSDSDIRKVIENLDISADAKSLLYSFSRATIKAGQFIIKIGRKIVDFICRIFNDYPSTSFGMIFGAIAGFLVSSIPILGIVLGPLFAPLAMSFGLVFGLREDIKDKDLARQIAAVNAGFSPLQS